MYILNTVVYEKSVHLSLILLMYFYLSFDGNILLLLLYLKLGMIFILETHYWCCIHRLKAKNECIGRIFSEP